MAKTYQPTWNSLRIKSTPKWFREAKFGIYTHWGVYSVPAKGPNATWYPLFMYHEHEDNHQYKYHVETYGHPSQFGYKDFIPMFTAEKFDADEWADLFKRSGAQYAGPVAEHHDGFCMWDTAYSEWNATKMEKAGYFMEAAEVSYTAQDIRFTAKNDTLYAICLGWPEELVKIESYKQLYEQEIKSVTMLGVDAKPEWSLTGEGLTIVPPNEKPCKHAFVFKIERKHPYAGYQRRRET